MPLISDPHTYRRKKNSTHHHQNLLLKVPHYQQKKKIHKNNFLYSFTEGGENRRQKGLELFELPYGWKK
jgi:hypothetical protein